MIKFSYDVPFTKNDTIRFFNPEKIGIEKVIYNDPATIVFWNDGTKTVVKCHECDEYDPKLGMLYCIAKKHFGGGRYNDVLAKHLPKAEVEAEDDFDWKGFENGRFIVKCSTLDAALKFNELCEARGLEGLDACAIRLIHKVRGAVHYIGAYGNIYFQNPYSICDFPVKEWK